MILIHVEKSTILLNIIFLILLFLGLFIFIFIKVSESDREVSLKSDNKQNHYLQEDEKKKTGQIKNILFNIDRENSKNKSSLTRM